MSDGSTKIALETLDALESRLQRVAWYLSGENEVGDVLHKVKVEGRDQTVQARLARLENNLGKLSSRSHEVHQLLSLCESASTTCRLLLTRNSDSKYPDLFQPTTSDIPSTLSAAELLAVVTACATTYPTTASRLNAIQDLHIPTVDASASLIGLHPRLSKIELLQESQAREIGQLRTRTASAIQRWYELGVLGEGECWTEWESRAVNVEKKVKRAENEQDQEAKDKETYQP